MNSPTITGIVSDIQRFCLHDGPGIRTTVFLKGCTLRCVWCHNPESLDRQPEILFYADKCIRCGRCVSVCPQHAHRLTPEGGHRFQRDLCLRCGTCAAQCPTGALTQVGRQMTVSEVMEEVERDKAFYRNSGGGLTLSGGEPLLQTDFCRELLQAARSSGLHTCVETAGLVPFRCFEALHPWVDLFLFDYKDSDPERQQRHTGAPRSVVVDNLLRLDRLGAKIILRCPLVPGFNDDPGHLEGIAALANQLQNIRGIDVIPYHALGVSKSAACGRETPPPISVPDERTVAYWRSSIARLCPNMSD